MALIPSPHGLTTRACENLGISYSTQLQKLKRASWPTVFMMNTVGSDGKVREMACLNLEAIPMWLTKINPKKITDRSSRRWRPRSLPSSGCSLLVELTHPSTMTRLGPLWPE
ncbi:MAG: hypothetical protein KC766_09790 [Myxococcales bacterium]|nr:hypothetical protein [Myxococcales bacterium]